MCFRIDRRIKAWRRSLTSLAILLQLLLQAGAVAAEPQPKYQGGCSSSGCHAGLVDRPVVHFPAQDDGCSACHVEQNAEKHEFRLMESGAKLCTECHEAEAFQGKVVHQPVDGGQCDACHDPHGSQIKGLLKAESTAALCNECHDETLKGLAFVHGPAAGQCTACHAPHASSHPRLLVEAERALCLQCHDDIKERMESSKHVHSPAESACVSCHHPHGADNRMMLTGAAPALCLDCHEETSEKFSEATVKHAPFEEPSGCLKCHDPHAGPSKMLSKASSTKELCLSCHDREIKTENRTIADIGSRLKTHSNPHGPVRDGDCTACHRGHGGTIASLLTEAYPARFYSPFNEDAYALCLDCHDAEAFESRETEDATNFRNGKVNLHHVHVNKPSKGRSCRACHDPHASSNEHHVAEGARFGTWTIPIRFEPTSTGGSCLSGCHRPYRYDRENPVSNVPSAE